MSNNVGSFIIIKNEAEYVGYSIMSVLDYVDEMVFADGNSTDGTLEIIDYIKRKYDKHNKIKLFLDKDCKNLQEDYVDLFNWTLKQVKSDYAWFLHPDMICLNPEKIKQNLSSNGIRYKVKVYSIAGEDRELIITYGRGLDWATIYRNDFGLYYHGFYGAGNEDCYFKDITGDDCTFWSMDRKLPYQIEDTPITLMHYCDTKPYNRRLGRMVECLKNIAPHKGIDEINSVALTHPRVTLKDSSFEGQLFKFEKNNIIPEVFTKYASEFEPLRKGV